MKAWGGSDGGGGGEEGFALWKGNPPMLYRNLHSARLRLLRV